MSQLKLVLIVISFMSSFAFAAGGSHLGINAGFGLPFTSQYGLTYVTASNKVSLDLTYNAFKITDGMASLSLIKPELMVKWHPFMGSFFLGAGLGQQTLTATGKDTLTGLTAEIEVTSMTVTPTLGWMWGMSDGGFYIGMDFGYEIQSGATTKITSILPDTNQAYIDAKTQGDKFGNTSFVVMTLLRLGYLF